MNHVSSYTIVALALLGAATGFAAETVPTDIQQPGTQPLEVGNLESPDKCDNCHGGYNTAVEPAHTWRGSMMANAGRDPIFWATLAIAEQDFDGAGDLCIRCHSTGGWLAGRSTPTDGSGLAAGDGDGVECDFCHKMTNPDDSEWQGEQFPPFMANNLGDPDSDPSEVMGYHGSGMASVWNGGDKLGPYVDAEARHKFLQSGFHRSVEFCGSCHDVSNAAVGNLAHNNGTQPTANPVVADGVLGGPVDGKAAFNNFPYEYGIVERTFSEFLSGAVSQTLVSDYLGLPEDLRGGALQAGYESAVVAGTGGNYEDGEPRYFSCQTCHLRPVNAPGCNKQGAPVRKDMPLHDMTGGNYWMPAAITYLDSLGKLRLGGGLSGTQITALSDGIVRAHKQLSEAASLIVEGETLRIVNHTGHKLISGYPEGRRMWLNIKWYDALDNLLREDGAYGPIGVTVPNPAGGQDIEVESLIDLHDPNTIIFEAHMGMTPEWAQQLLAPPFNVPAGLVLTYDRYTGAAELTLGQLAASDEVHETFHFVLNNAVVSDNRIPPYGMDYEKARGRNALPVPATQYGGGGAAYNGLTDVYEYWSEKTLVPPGPEAVYATIDLLYQPTSWEYVQFLYLANNRQNAFLADEGVNMLDAWLNAGDAGLRMAKPYVMASTVWGEAPVPAEIPLIVDSQTTWSVDKQGRFVAPSGTFNPRDSVGIRAHVVDLPTNQALSGAQVFVEVRDGTGGVVVSLQGFSDETGNADLRWKTGRREAVGAYTATVVEVIKSGYAFDPALSQVEVVFTIE
jgi:hypothetical protein